MSSISYFTSYYQSLIVWVCQILNFWPECVFCYNIGMGIYLMEAILNVVHVLWFCPLGTGQEGKQGILLCTVKALYIHMHIGTLGRAVKDAIVRKLSLYGSPHSISFSMAWNVPSKHTHTHTHTHKSLEIAHEWLQRWLHILSLRLIIQWYDHKYASCYMVTTS